MNSQSNQYEPCTPLRGGVSQKKGVTNENHYCPADEINSDDGEINEPDLDVLSSEIMSELISISRAFMLGAYAREGLSSNMNRRAHGG